MTGYVFWIYSTNVTCVVVFFSESEGVDLVGVFVDVVGPDAFKITIGLFP